jgi:general secretion pathway protein J
MKPSRPLRVRGFTLLEILVAVGIFALFSTMAYAGLVRILDTRDRLEAERAFWRGLTLTFTQMEDDLAQARQRTIRDSIGATVLAFRGQPVDARALGDPSLEFTRGGVLTLGEGPIPDMQRIGYRIREGSLWRLVWPALDQPPTNTPREYLLLAGVQDMKLRFHATGGEWQDRWPGDVNVQKGLPDAVEVTMVMDGRGEFMRLMLVHR